MTQATNMFRRLALGVAAPALLALICGLVLGRPPVWQPAAITLAVCLAIGVGAVPTLAGYQFTLWIVAAVTAAMIVPNAFLHWGRIDLRNKWLLLVVIQLVMFGMGIHMSVRDFAGVARMPRGVIVGLVGHFTVMPLVGYALTRLFTFPPEIAAGIVLIGSCSSGLASNVMAYIARANLALSVTVTTFSTMLAPVMTPLWMKALAGAYVRVDVVGMMMEIVKFVVVPVGAALLHDYLKFASTAGRRRVYAMGVVGVVYLIVICFEASSWIPSPMISLLGFLLATFVVAIVYHELSRRIHWLDRVMPRLSMFGIIYFTAVTTAAGRNNLLAVGGLLFVAAALHNGLGYALGYGVARAAGMNRNDSRTVAIEVGLQNGGMAAGLAASTGKLGTVGLAAAIFSPWMNVSGSILANYWRRRPVHEPPDVAIDPVPVAPTPA
jgi:BASS family bile acid:Na+ symporter